MIGWKLYLEFHKIYFRTAVMQYPFSGFIFHIRWCWYCKFCRPQYIVCFQEKLRWGYRILTTNLNFFVAMVSKYLLKSNAGKYHFLASSCGKVSLNVNNYNIENSKIENLLGVKFDITLTFDEHVSDLYKKN